MGMKTVNKATKEQVEMLIQKYKTNEKVMDILYTGKVNTLIMLEHGFQKGIAITRLAGGTNLVSLPECKNGSYLCNDKYSFQMHMAIVRKILTNFANNNPQYFMLKPNSQRYAITDQFAIDLLMHNREKGFDYIEFLDLLPFISNYAIFEEIAKTFYLPFVKDKTLEYVNKICWRKKKPFTVKISYNKKPLEKSYTKYGSQNIQSIKIDELLKEMKIYYDSGLKTYHTVAYCTYFPDNLSKIFPLCKIETFQSIYDHYREFKPKNGGKDKLHKAHESIIFPKYSIVDCVQMSTLWSYKKIFGKFVAEEANRFIIFVNYHAGEVFHGAGGIGHNLFSNGDESSA
jgi:hypothetical protein